MRITETLLNRATRIGLFLMAVAVLLVQAPAAHAAAGNTGLKIYSVDGAGALSGATYRQDTIVLFNPTAASITCSTCAIQTHSGTSNIGAWTVYKLPNFTVPAGGFYMISASSPTLATFGSLAPIPYDYQLQTIELGTPSATQNILSSTVGVIALTSIQTALTASAASQCGTGSQLVDFVAYGSTTATNAATTATPSSCYAGSGAAYYDGSTAYGRQLGVTRKNKCIDTFDNLADFVNVPPVYFNSSSAPQVCPTGTQLSAVVSATPASVNPGGSVTFTAVVTKATSPASTGLNVVLNLDSPYFAGTPQQMYDDGTHGDAVANDGTYSLAGSVPTTIVSGYTYPANVTVTDTLGQSYTGSTPLTVGGVFIPPYSGNTSIRIIAWYGAGNLSKSEYGRDTVILFNPTQGAITMNGWSLQTGGTTGAFTAVSYLLPNVTIPAGGFYAIAGSGPSYISSAGCSGANCNTNYAYDYQLKTLEGTATAADNDLSSTAITVALVNNQSPLGTCPKTSANLVDLIGIAAWDGSSPVTCYAGSGSAPYTPATLNGGATNIHNTVYPYATVRKNRCNNTFDNANDFILGYIEFANSTTTPKPCPAGAQLAVVSSVATPGSTGILDPVTFTATVSPATTPNSTSLAVTADLSNLGLSATQPMYDDGTHGDLVAGDKTYTIATASTGGSIGSVPGLIISATDAQGDLARSNISYVVNPGTIALSTTTATATVTAGGVVTFPITAKAAHGYGGVLNITCVGSPNANTLGVPVATQCVATPNEVTVSNNGTNTFSLAIATGTTFSAGVMSRSLPFGLIGILSIGVLTVGVFRRKHLPQALLLALVAFMTLNTTACGKNGGLGNTNAAPGVYTYVVTATDSNLAIITNSLTLTVTVK